MDLLKRALFVVGGILIGTWLVGIFVIGNTGDALPQNERMGEWRKAKIRTQCYGAVAEERREPDAPKRPETVNIDIRDYHQVLNTSAALNCYVVTNRDAICDKDNRAYIVDYIGRYFKTKEKMISDAADKGEAEGRAMLALWDTPRNRAIAAALDADIEHGRLARGDFGWMVPDALVPMFEQHPDAKDSCLRQASQR
jgi:hypothetical protein